MQAPSGVRPRLLLFPCNGNAMEALDAALPSFDVIGFVDDSPEKQVRGGPLGLPVFDRGALERYPDAFVLAVPGSPTTFRQRAGAVTSLRVPPERFATVIHPRASISPLARVGHNVLLLAGVVVTANAVIGDHVCVLANTVLHHDVVVDDWCLVGSNVTLAGSVRLGRNSYVGSGTAIKNGLQIGEATLVGLGSVVVRDTAAGTTVAGNPARPLPPRSAG